MKDQNHNASLYDRIGGGEAVQKAVELFYQKILCDDHINHFFTGIDMKAQLKKQKIFLTYAFGGPVNYSGKALRNAHSHLVAKGLNSGHFDAVAGHLHDTLMQLGLSPDLIDEIMQIVGATKRDVLGL